MNAQPRLPRIVWLGLAVVLAAAAVLSFDALRALALAVGISSALAWLLPIAVDAGAAVSCAVWLGRRATPDAARFAGRMTWALLAVTVLGNAAQLGMAAHHIAPPWWVAVAVGAIPPAVVGSTVHLVVLLVRGGLALDAQADSADQEDETVTEPVQAEPAPAAPVQPAVQASAPDVQQGETAEERRLREQRDRAKRSRERRSRHDAGDHALCDPKRCPDARRLVIAS